MKINLCMTVGDKEEKRTDCLERALKLADEGIVIDTGSIERTIRLLKERYENNDIKNTNPKFKGAIHEQTEGNSYASGASSMTVVSPDEAERILISGLAEDKSNFDILYSLGNLYQYMNKNRLATDLYKKALQNARNEDNVNEIYKRLKTLGAYEETINKSEKRCTENKEKAPAITIITWAYNVKKYIKECIESVLNQSFTDFEWVILDNDCTDGTSEILKEYAKRDSRIKLFRNERNSMIHNEPNNPDYTEYVNNLKSEYMCNLDSDDYLHPDFLKELYTAAKNSNADVVICGNETFKENNPEHRSIRIPPVFFKDDITKLGDIFPQIYDYFRPLWGKLVRVSVNYLSRKYFINNKMKMANADTMLCLYYLRFSSSVASIDKALYYYRIREDSYFHSQVNRNRYLDCLKIHDDSKNVYKESRSLLESWNKLTSDNFNFLGEILYFSLKDCIAIAANAVKMTAKERIEVITAIFSDTDTKKSIERAGLLNNLFAGAIEGLNDIVQGYGRI